MTERIRWITTTADKLWSEETPFSKIDSGLPNLAVTQETYQCWLGFGGCFNELGWKVLSRMEPKRREIIVRELFQPGLELQFNFCRVPIGANDYVESWYSLNETDADFEMRDFSIQRDHQYLIPYIRQAKSYCPDLKLFASPWSPPTWMKHPQVYNGGSLIWDEKILKAYALYLLTFVEAYRQEGIDIQQLHVQNEPVSGQKFPSCIWTGAQLRDFIRDYLGPLFEKNRIATEIWLGTLNGPEVDQRFLYTTYNDYANLVLHDEKARRFIRGVGYQWRGKYALQRTRMGWLEIPLIQTENECGDGENTWDYAWYVFDLMHHYLTNDVSAYVYWNMVLAPGGESTWGWRQNSLITVNPQTQVVTFNPEYYVLKHFSKFIRPGAQRIGLTGEWSANAVAFRNQKDTVIVIRNPFPELSKVTMEFDGVYYRYQLQPSSLNTIIIE